MLRFFRWLPPIRRLDEYLKERNWRNFEREVSAGKIISLSDEGFQIHDPKGKVIFVQWAAINSINTFKVDLFTVDMICFEFYQNDESRVEINEHMEGYKAIVDILPSKFEGFDQDWFSKVFKPAFATNFTEVWKRK